MWQELAAALAAALLGTAAFWNGFITAGAVYLINVAIAVHILYLTLAAHGISRFDRRTGGEHGERRWLLWAAAAIAAASVVVPVVLRQTTSLAALRDNLVFGGMAFFFCVWAALVPDPGEAGEASEPGGKAEEGPRGEPRPAP